MEHDGCKGCLYETELETSEHCMGCIQNAVDKYTPMTNADRIRNMTDEELAEHFSELIKDTKQQEYCEDVSDWLEWLKKKVE